MPHITSPRNSIWIITTKAIHSHPNIDPKFHPYHIMIYEGIR